MKTYNMKFQIGDVVFCSKKIPIANFVMGDTFNSEPINYLPENDAELPQYYSKLSIAPDLVNNKITIKDNKLFYVRSIYNNHYIRLSDYNSFDEYLMKFSSKSRATLKRKVRKAEADSFSYKIYSQSDDVEEFHTHAVAVGDRTYQNNLFNSSIPNDNDFKANIISLAENEKFLGLILFKDLKPCAYLYLPIHSDQYVYAYLGYLPEYHKSSPGTVLQFYAFQYIFDGKRSATYFDFTEGDGQHKEFFSTEKKLCCDCLVVENSITNRLLFNSQVTVDKFSESLGAFLEKYNLRSKIKKIIRR